MASQPEKIKIIDPFVLYCERVHGWHCFKTHGSMFQSGFPDQYMVHKDYAPKWWEGKIREAGSSYVSFTRAQKVVFPTWLANNVSIWIVAADDLRGNKQKLEEQYCLLFKPHNCYYYLNSFLRKKIYG
jgi:hypothetical protein